MSDTICCSASSGDSKAHVRGSDPVPVRCCHTELIPESQRCCDGVGYNPVKYVCSDEISAGMATEVIDTEPLRRCRFGDGKRNTLFITIFLK